MPESPSGDCGRAGNEMLGAVGPRPFPAQTFSKSDKDLIVNALVSACDAKDGAQDGLVYNTRACDFDPVAALTCTGAKTDGCLPQQQTAALKKAFAGPRDSRQNQIYPGFPWDTGITASGLGIPGSIPGLLSPGPGPLGPPNLSTEIDVDREAFALANDPRQVGDTTLWTNLNTFSSRGGKLAFYHGVSDPWFSALDTVDYYEKMSAANGGDKTAEWSRSFLVPGMGHCQGGAAPLDTFDLLTAVVGLGREGEGPGRGSCHRARVLRAQPAAVSVPGTCPLQGRR